MANHFRAGAAAAVPAIVEFAPTRHRTLVTSLVVVPVAFGVLSASVTASFLLPLVGWRGLAAVGFLPIILAILTMIIMPESPRWLISKGRVREAQASIRKLYRVGGDTFALPTLQQASSATFADLFAEHHRRDRISAGHGVVPQEHDGQPGGRHLDTAGHGALAGQLALDAARQLLPLQPDAHAIGGGRDDPLLLLESPLGTPANPQSLPHPRCKFSLQPKSQNE